MSVINSISWFGGQKSGLRFFCPFFVISQLHLSAIPRAITNSPAFAPLGPEALLPHSRSEPLEITDGWASGALCGRWVRGFTHSGCPSLSEEKMSAFIFKHWPQSQACRGRSWATSRIIYNFRLYNAGKNTQKIPFMFCFDCTTSVIVPEFKTIKLRYWF